MESNKQLFGESTCKLEAEVHYQETLQMLLHRVGIDLLLLFSHKSVAPQPWNTHIYLLNTATQN